MMVDSRDCMRGPGTDPDKSPGTALSSPDGSRLWFVYPVLTCDYEGGPGDPGGQALMTGQ